MPRSDGSSCAAGPSEADTGAAFALSHTLASLAAATCNSLPKVLNLIQDTFAFMKELQWVQGHCKLRVAHQHQSNFSLQPCGHGNSGLGRVFRLAGALSQREHVKKGLLAKPLRSLASSLRLASSLPCLASLQPLEYRFAERGQVLEQSHPGRDSGQQSQVFTRVRTDSNTSCLICQLLVWGSLFRILYQAASVDRRPYIPGQLSARGAEASAPGLKAWLCSEPRVSMHFISKVLMMPDMCRSLCPFRVRWRSSRLADSGSPNRYGADELFSESRNVEVCS